MRRLIPWLWESRATAARIARAGLVPLATGVRAATAARTYAYRAGYFPTRRMAAPVVSVGNLSVGGTGKTPIASWIAGWYLGQGRTPGVVLRGYGRDEGAVHREEVPQAIVIENADRFAGMQAAAAQGAEVLILDDGFQRLDVARDLDIVLVAAESLEASRWMLPAGPWREPAAALARAQLAVITHKRAGEEQVAAARRWLAGRAGKGGFAAVAELGIGRFEGLWTGRAMDASLLRGARALVTAGIADPASFAAQLRRLGVHVTLKAWPDHHAYRARDVAELVQAARGADFAVMTAKDAVKLCNCWPRSESEPFVARLKVHWQDGAERVIEALQRLSSRGGGSRS